MKNIIFAFIDRNYNLLFNKKKCIKIFFPIKLYKYNDIITNGNCNLRNLGNNWFKLK